MADSSHESAPNRDNVEQMTAPSRNQFWRVWSFL